MSNNFPIQIGVAAIILNEREEILIARSPKTNDGWTLPGGHMLFGETISETLAREIKEEVGLDVKFESIVRVCEVIRKQKNLHLISFHVSCHISGGQVLLDNRELNEWRWINIAEAITLIEMEDFKESLKKYDQKQRSL